MRLDQVRGCIVNAKQRQTGPHRSRNIAALRGTAGTEQKRRSPSVCPISVERLPTSGHWTCQKASEPQEKSRDASTLLGMTILAGSCWFERSTGRPFKTVSNERKLFIDCASRFCIGAKATNYGGSRIHRLCLYRTARPTMFSRERQGWRSRWGGTS